MASTNRRPVTLLCILDGFGLNPNQEGNAVAIAQTPVFDELWNGSPHSTLTTYGERVGLPAGQMGNSEVGHLNIGAGRVVEQWLLRISRELGENVLIHSQPFQDLLANTGQQRLHLIGLYSDGGVHSHGNHLHALLEHLADSDINEVILHLITDGRDTAPTGAADYVKQLEKTLQRYKNISIGSVMGRFYAMDRDHRWERVKEAYDTITGNTDRTSDTASSYISDSYASGITDEFLKPAVINPTPLTANDSVLFWNFRTDRLRELASALCLPKFDYFDRTIAPIRPEQTLCFTEYDPSLNLPYLFSPLKIQNHLGAVVSRAGLKQLRVAETEKYPHVTYFFNGGTEDLLPGEERKLVPSPREVATYDLKPEMSATGVTEAVLEGIQSGQYNFIVVNFANPDMVGHTGVLSATVKAVEAVDSCLGRLLTALKEKNGQALILADHGNADQMINYEDGSPHTAHTTHPVPVIAFNCHEPTRLTEDGALCDVAPTVLKMMGIEQPVEMTGRPLTSN